jgi:hypothetical protein
MAPTLALLAAPTGGASVHGWLCMAGRLRGHGAMLREFPATPLGTALRETLS